MQSGNHLQVPECMVTSANETFWSSYTTASIEGHYVKLITSICTMSLLNLEVNLEVNPEVKTNLFSLGQERRVYGSSLHPRY